LTSARDLPVKTVVAAARVDRCHSATASPNGIWSHGRMIATYTARVWRGPSQRLQQTFRLQAEHERVQILKRKMENTVQDVSLKNKSVFSFLRQLTT